MPLPPLTLVIGGAASGKSAFAEGLVRQAGGRRVYLATAEAHDAEMRARIEAHKQARAADGWLTIEAPDNAAGVIAGLAAGDTVLLDCATLWLSNLMLAGRDWLAEADGLLAAISASPAQVVIVSNETGQGIVPDNALARAFREAQGRLNQKIAADAGLVVAVIAGLPMTLKGKLP